MKTFKKQTFNETVENCYKCIENVCNGKFVGFIGCEKLPLLICGAGVTFEEGDLVILPFHVPVSELYITSLTSILMESFCF